jgi:hypothetical protein
MNDLDLIRDLGAELDPESRPPARMRERFVTAIRYPQRAAGRRRIPWPAAAVGAVAVVALAAIYAWNAPDSGSRPERRAADTQPDGRAADTRPERQVVEMDGRQVLLAAASSARARDEQAPDPDSFIYTRLKHLEKNLENGQGTRFESERWWPVDGAGGALVAHSDMEGASLTCNPGPQGAGAYPNPTKEHIEACMTDPGYVTGLPDDPDAMLAYLNEQPRPAEAGDPKFATVFGNAWELLKWRMMEPEARATILEVLAGLPRLEMHPDVKTLGGKTGTAVAFSPTRRERFELIFDSETHDLIGSRQTWFEFTGDAAGREVAWVEASVVMEQAVVSEMRQRPGGSRNSEEIQIVVHGEHYGTQPGFE